MALPYYVKKRITDVIISIIMLLFLALTLLPVGWMVFSSLKSSSDIAIGRVGLSRSVTGQVEVHWGNYVDMWKNVNFGLYLKNSLIICGSTMFLAMILSTLAAYALSRFKFPGSDFFSNTILATQMIPAIMYLIPLYIMFVKFTVMTGIPVKGTYLGLILIYSAFFVPFSIWILRGFFASIPKELEEAARIDGCSPLQVFWYIALPLALPGIIATGIYLFLQAWDELMFAWVLTNGDTMTIPVGIRLFVGNYQNRFDLMMAAATVATIPVVILFFMLQKHIVRGLTAGAVKG
jgi:multiple sugar transport system permease protein